MFIRTGNIFLLSLPLRRALEIYHLPIPIEPLTLNEIKHYTKSYRPLFSSEDVSVHEQLISLITAMEYFVDSHELQAISVELMKTYSDALDKLT